MKTAGTAWTLRDIALKCRYLSDKYDRERLGGLGAENIKNVLVIQAASRSGSSFLYRLLAGLPGVISLNGEDSVFQKLGGIGPVNSAADSDSLPADLAPEPEAARRIAADILLDSGRVYSGEGPFPAQNYAADCARRFLLQWPGAGADPDAVYRCAAAAVELELRKEAVFDAQACWASFLALLDGRGMAVDPWRYDLRPGLIRRLSPGSAPPAGPPPLGGLEDPPFVVPEPRVFPRAAGRETLLLKSSSNCYRAGFIQKLFPSARFRFVLLSRNPMAAVSSLMDGWLSGGFFSHDVGGITELAIKGYTEPEKGWTRRWWKFDLPPGWARYRAGTLAEVCAFQWASANRRILADSASGLLGETMRVRYEDLPEPASQRRELRRVMDFAGLPGEAAAGKRAAAPVMAVTPPRPHKWLKRKTELLPLCSERELRAVSLELGYELRSPELLP